MGDFNEIRSNVEKRGGPNRAESTFKDFNNMLRHCDLHELRSTCDRFSWSGRRYDHYISCCLDKTMANTEWHTLFPNAETKFLDFGGSNHRPVITHLLDKVQFYKHPFRYDGRLFSDTTFREESSAFWNYINDPARSFDQSLASMRRWIVTWRKKHQFNSATRIDTIKRRINHLHNNPTRDHNEMQLMRKQLNDAYLDEERYWKIKSRNLWLKEGDKQTKFFHATTRTRRTRNRIISIEKEDGSISRGDKAIGIAAEEFYSKLFQSELHSQDDDRCFINFAPRISNETNDKLISPISETEIQDAVFDIGPDKAPGYDGFTGRFYQQFWPILKQSVTSEIRHFFATGRFNGLTNHTLLCLIPKTEVPRSFSEFRPISLCSVLYKIVSKILVTRLKEHLPQVISATQCAFIPGRQIIDNVIITQEYLHSLKSRKRWSKSYMAIKTDISKAYDHIEWSFVRKTLTHMGFHNTWINWIMNFITTVSFSVLINGVPSGRFIPTRGIRQGDPLSPYIFILCAEILTHNLNQAASSNRLKGMKISNNGPSISHLMFADDTIFFCQAHPRSCTTIKQILHDYGKCSGQRINLNKSCITFGGRVSHCMRTRLRHILQIFNDGGNGRYLGMPENIGRNKKEIFDFIATKVTDRIQGWTSKYLSPAGKEILLKTIALALPVYTMNVFKIPLGVCETIEKSLTRYWWKTGNSHRAMHWISWKRMGYPKKEGGMGFRDIAKFNEAMLAKQAWRLLQSPNSLVVRVLRNRYFRDSEILSAGLGTKPSYVWRSLLVGRDLLRKGLKFLIGSGTTTRIWHDAWLPTHTPRPARPSTPQSAMILQKVQDLINPNTGQWDVNKLVQHVDPEDVQIIESIRLSKEGGPDLLGWSYTTSGIYSVKSGYWLATHLPHDPRIPPPPGDQALKNRIWKLQTAPKLRHFLWRLASNSLPTGEILMQRHISSDSQCRRCCSADESFNHLFFLCPYAQMIWRASPVYNHLLADPTISVTSKLNTIFSALTDTNGVSVNHQLPLWILWRIWKSRNILMFQQKSIPWRKLLRLALNDTLEWTQLTKQTEPSARPSHNSRPNPPSNWRRPPPGFVKCNFDCGFRININSRAGWIVRDGNGTYKEGALAIGFQSQDSLEAELQAMLMAIQQIWYKGYRHVIVEGDNQKAIHIAQGKTLNFTHYNLIRDIKVWSNKFEEIRFQWVPRSNNKVADRIVRSLIPVNCSFTFFSKPPFWLYDSLWEDYSVSI